MWNRVPAAIVATYDRTSRIGARTEGQFGKERNVGSRVGKGVISAVRGGPVSVEELTVGDPGPGEVLVRVAASGVCHSDMHYVDGHLGEDFPFLLGHEGSGYIEAVGDGVDAARVGQFIVLTYRAPCHECPCCLAGRSDHCRQPLEAATRPETRDGRQLTPALSLGTFSDYLIVAAPQAIPVSTDCPPEQASLLGCAVSTGVGSVLRTAGVEPGRTVAVFGAGGVGVNVIQGARLARAGRIIAVDLVSKKLDWATSFGATDVVDASRTDPVEEVRELTGGYGVDYSFDAVGLSTTLRQCVEVLDYRGTAVLIGFPSADQVLTLPMQRFFFPGTTLRVSLNGDSLASRDFPQLIRWYLDGQLDLDSLVTERIGLADVGAAFEGIHRGDTIRSVISLP